MAEGEDIETTEATTAMEEDELGEGLEPEQHTPAENGENISKLDIITNYVMR